ncbi:MAG TPA: hypothetical protein VNQ90_12305 [Chthoniobacteraceae bacterium]|nr:hypothetical protein [Chthoniobacteraceae bacterium]
MTPLSIQLNERLGAVKALHGVNLGPIDRFWFLDFSEFYRRARIPSVRTHDCQRYLLDAVDLHYLFPNPDADPDDPRNYRFGTTDDYLRSILDAGAEVYFRLGETFECPKAPRRTYVRPERWNARTLARVCTNIARHYNEGWAEGYHWKIRRWQFWNEPDNEWNAAPEKRTCWTGSPEEFYHYYGHVATAMKGHDASLTVGLGGFMFPSMVLPPDYDGEEVGFLAAASRENPQQVKENPWRHLRPLLEAGPIDSFSWHRYTRSWERVANMARMVRQCLDENGLVHAENHLTEWHYMPKFEDERGVFDWFQARWDRDECRIEHAEEVMGGPEGAAYVFGTLAKLQDAAVDIAHYYTGITTPGLGLFTVNGQPKKTFLAMEAFGGFLDGERVRVEGGEADRVIALAVRHGDAVRVGIAHLRPSAREVTLCLQGAAAPLSMTAAHQLGPDGWSPLETDCRWENKTDIVTVPLHGSGVTLLDLAPL